MKKREREGERRWENKIFWIKHPEWVGASKIKSREAAKCRAFKWAGWRYSFTSHPIFPCFMAHPFFVFLFDFAEACWCLAFLVLVPSFLWVDLWLDCFPAQPVSNLCFGVNFWCDSRNELPHMYDPSTGTGRGWAGLGAKCPDFYLPNPGPRCAGCQRVRTKVS